MHVKVAFVLALVLVSAQGRAEPRTADAVVARVDGRPILLSELMRSARPRVSRTEPAWQRAYILRKLLREALEEAIVSELLLERARRLELRLAEGEVDAVVARIAADQRLSVDELLAKVHAAGLTPAAYRAELERQLLERRLLFAEPYGKAGRPPSEPLARTRWLDRRRRLLTDELRRRACVERFGRL